MSARIPPAFVSHGAPTLALETQAPAHVFLQGLAARVGAPRAILCASAHFETTAPVLTATARPGTIHDFGGFPPPLYALRYPAPGDPELAERARQLITDAGMPCALDATRGFDHGAWVPLRLAFPAAQVPVIELSVQSDRDAAHHFALGRALAPLAADGVWILGSGGATHHLGRMRWDAPPGEAPADVRAFEAWLVGAIEGGDTDALLAWRSAAPHPAGSHPTPEHFLPLFVALGAAGPGARGTTLHRGFVLGALAMDAFLWD